MFYTHINWGGTWKIIEENSKSFTVIMITEPKDWKQMKELFGWFAVMTLDNDARVYFKPISKVKSYKEWM